MSNTNVDLHVADYTESSTQYAAWVNVTVTRTDPDGSKSQVATILPKAK
jgi:hypothetical protein